jgi:hypothetical protein
VRSRWTPCTPSAAVPTDAVTMGGIVFRVRASVPALDPLCQRPPSHPHSWTCLCASIAWVLIASLLTHATHAMRRQRSGGQLQSAHAPRLVVKCSGRTAWCAAVALWSLGCMAYPTPPPYRCRHSLARSEFLFARRRHHGRRWDVCAFWLAAVWRATPPCPWLGAEASTLIRTCAVPVIVSVGRPMSVCGLGWSR